MLFAAEWTPWPTVSPAAVLLVVASLAPVPYLLYRLFRRIKGIFLVR